MTLQRTQALRERIQEAMGHLTQEHLRRVNLTDTDAQLMKRRQGIMPAYNAQVVAAPVEIGPGRERGMLITAATVVTTASDTAQLIPMLQQAEELTGARAPVTLEDGGYHTAGALQRGAQRGDLLVMPERYPVETQGPYFKDRFVYDPVTDSYICPLGQRLAFQGQRRSNGKSAGPIRIYRGSPRGVPSVPGLWSVHQGQE